MKIEDTQIKVGTFITSPEVYLFLRKKSLDEFKRIAGSAVTYTDENEEMFLNAWRRNRVEQLITKHPEVADLDHLLLYLCNTNDCREVEGVKHDLSHKERRNPGCLSR